MHSAVGSTDDEKSEGVIHDRTANIVKVLYQLLVSKASIFCFSFNPGGRLSDVVNGALGKTCRPTELVQAVYIGSRLVRFWHEPAYDLAACGERKV